MGFGLGGKHGHGDEHSAELAEMDLRVRALETVLTEKGYVDPAALDRIVETFETRVGPRIGAGIVARAWRDPEFKRRLLADAGAAINATDPVYPVGNHLIAVENTPRVHNMVVCTLCSCYPWEILGLPPVWYKVGAVPLACRARPAGRVGRFRRYLAARNGDPRVGLDGRNAVLGRTGAAARQRGIERRAARGAGDAR
jgi:hypothetical protein